MKDETYTIMIIPSSRAQSHAKQQFVKQFSIHRWAIFFLMLFVIVITASVISIAVISVVRANRLNVKYKNLQTVHNSQQDEYQRIKVEIEKVSEMESTIRDVLGLDDNESNPSALGQGGFGGGEMSEVSEDFPQQSPSQESFSVPQASIDDNASLVEKASTLNARLRNIIDFVQAKKTEMSQMPSINPIQSGKFWYSSGFRNRKHPLTGKWQMHRGLDISARISTPVSATADGTVSSITKDAYLGRCVKIDHNPQYSTVYAHLHRYAEGLKKGSVVKRGDIIGYVGSSGRTTGPHLHYEVWENGKPKNPKHYILD